MRVAGVRHDGAYWLVIDGGLSVILHGDKSSPASDPSDIERLGPWTEPTGVTGQQRRDLTAKLDAAKTMPLGSFTPAKATKRKFKFEYESTDETPAKEKDEKVVGDVPDENPDDSIEEKTPEKGEEKAQ